MLYPDELQPQICNWCLRRDTYAVRAFGRQVEETPVVHLSFSVVLVSCARGPLPLSCAMPCFKAALERWPRGRRRRFAKPLYGPKAVSRVRIPPSPQRGFCEDKKEEDAAGRGGAPGRRRMRGERRDRHLHVRPCVQR